MKKSLILVCVLAAAFGTLAAIGYRLVLADESLTNAYYWRSMLKEYASGEASSRQDAYYSYSIEEDGNYIQIDRIADAETIPEDTLYTWKDEEALIKTILGNTHE